MREMYNLAVGLALSAATAANCIAYERLVKRHGFGVIVLLQACYVAVYVGIATFGLDGTRAQLRALLADRSSVAFGAVYLLSSVTVPLWFLITTRTNVVTGSVFEVVYVPLLMLVYIFLGSTRLNATFVVGGLLVVCGVLVMSYSQDP